MRVGQVDAVTLVRKPEIERTAYHEKMNAIAELVAADMFRPEYKQLEYLPNEIKLSWRCADRCKTCRRQPHGMKILDWGLLELARRDGWNSALSRMESIADLSRIDFRLYLGTFRLHPTTFGVIGHWYPKRQEQASLFNPATP